MKILVTGGAGFIGSHLVGYLIEKGHEVVVVDNLISGKIENINPKCRNYEVNIQNFNYPTEKYGSNIIEIFDIEKPEIVFHLAAVSRTPWAIEQPQWTYKTNIEGSANILEAAKITGVKKVVLASSNIVYAAQTPYKTSKLAMEQVARDYNDLYDLPTICLRFSNVAGSKRQHEDNVLASLAKSKRENGKIVITGDGEQTRNFTYVMDVCEALWLASQSEVRGTELDIMHPKAWSLNEIAKFFDCPFEYIPDRKGDIKHLKMGIGPEKAKELMGFEAKTGLEDYIKIYTEV